jgi:hypothetical protein
MKINHPNRTSTTGLILFLLLVPSASRSVRAQSSAALLVKPWEADQVVEDKSRLLFFSGGHSQNSGRSFDLTTFESQGRVRILPGREASPRLGYDVTYLNTHNGQPGFPGQLLDASVAAGTFLSQTNGWVTGLTLGLGYAGDQPFANGRAWYGRADFVLAKKFDEIDAVGIGIDYDGHRTYAPDIPLPGIGWSHQLDPTLLMVLGVPVTSITWKPDPRLRIYADYILLTDFDIDVGFEIVKHWTVFGALETRDDAFYASSLKDHHRLLYTQRRAEIGVRWEPAKFVTLSLSGGYGFGTRFESGWDYRNTHSVLHASPEPFVAVAAAVQF